MLSRKDDDFFKIRSPWKSGKFPIAVGLRPILDETPAFHQDVHYAQFLQHKRELRKENLHRIYPTPVEVSSEELRLIAQEIKGRLTFPLELNPQATPPYRDEFDEVCSHLQEDIALWKCDGEREWLGALHLSSPNHWAPEEKVGHSFAHVHLPVPKIEPINKIAVRLFHQSFERGVQERLAWGVATDTRLDHHPLTRPKGRSFNPQEPELFIRLERQTLIPTESRELLIFTIRTYFLNVADFDREEKDSLSDAINSMSEDLLGYKGLTQSRADILHWLES